MSAIDSLCQLANQLKQQNHRHALQLDLEPQHSTQLLNEFIQQQRIESDRIAWLGGEQSAVTAQHYTFKQGKALLGQEVKMLVVDLSLGFDANSFNASLGALVGGGVAFIINQSCLETNYATQWLNNQLQHWPKLTSLDEDFTWQLTEHTDDSIEPFSQQLTAIEAIEKVVTGHRRRPLVINANRGRGKTASLGMAAAKLMTERVLNIVVTAPSINALSPLFYFLKRGVGELEWQTQQPHHWVLANGSQLRFVAPDDLYLNQVQADLLLVDEAAALPLPMLTHFVEHYHRMVLSSTIHGYEGCGRGFTLKFMAWLEQNRPGWKQLELTQPIRWAQYDPLENWSFDAFLLNSDQIQSEMQAQPHSCLPDEVSESELSLQRVTKERLVVEPKLYASIFGLLVNAHYQTSPNDVLQVLAADDIEVYQINYHPSKLLASKSLDSKQGSGETAIAVGCLLICHEGGLERDLISDIQVGKRRPKGHLAAAHLANHLALFEPAAQTSARIMRIAVDSQWQGKGIGTHALTLLAEQLKNKVDFLSVSFGATSELVSFWKRVFKFVALGSRRDHVSGCYSAFMAQPLSLSSQAWIKQAQYTCRAHFKSALPFQYQAIDHATLAELLLEQSDNDEFILPAVLHNYALGGNSFETALPVLQAFMLQYLCYHEQTSQLLNQTQLPVVIDKVVLCLSWQTVANKYQLAGRKAIEQQLKQWLLQFTV